MSQRVLRYRSLWLFIGWSLVILVIYGSLTTKPVQLDVRYFDKFSHLFSYFVLMGWFVQIYSKYSQRLFWTLFFVALGIALEYLQALGGVRYFEWADMLANSTGVLLALMLAPTRFANSLH
ncbi:MAG: VanZ family protein, partial [Gammaproteobacteria bacterium]